MSERRGTVRVDPLVSAVHRLDPESDETTWARSERSAADRVLTEASDAGTVLRDDIERFRRDVESAEEYIAGRLASIAGGTEVHGARGETVRVSQTFWGFVDSPYPGAPSSLTRRLSLSENLESALSDAVASRIRWLGSAPDGDISDWLASHPDFAQAVGFVEPHRAAALWEDLASASTAGEPSGTGPGQWVSGPLAHLFALAPLAIGNLNGIPAAQRSMFNREGLAQLLEDADCVSSSLAIVSWRSLRSWTCASHVRAFFRVDDDAAGSRDCTIQPIPIDQKKAPPI